MGPKGYQGDAGPLGEKGPTLIGPAGPAGHVGPTGPLGPTGAIGAKGPTTIGPVGAMGPSGAQGPKGNLGPAGPQGPVGIVPCWVSYREFWFNSDSSDIMDTQKNMLSDIATYCKNNPSLVLGLDGYIDSNHKDLSNNRINNVRDGLINAGVPANRIKIGDFGDSKLRRDGRVEVLIMTGQ
jgi:hypothetical protein